jgi:hypothetical protein
LHFSFLILDSRWDSLYVGSTRRKAATYTEQRKHRINADKHPCLEWDSNPQSVFEQAKTFHALDRETTVIDTCVFTRTK